MRTVYAMVTTNCNLDCPHCDIKTDNADKWNAETFISQLNVKDHNIIFGGEPSLHMDRVEKVAPYCDSISTNLLYLPQKLIELCDERLSVATSWNVSRFTPAQYELWLKNVQKLKYKPLLLVTLTPDLLADETFLNRVQEDFAPLFDSISFEQLHDSTKTQEYYDKVDEWLCTLYRGWTQKSIDLICNNFYGAPFYDCDNTYTLRPDGSMKYGCPQYDGAKVPMGCYTCEKAGTCRPCKLQSYCTAPKKLLQMIEEVNHVKFSSNHKGHSC